MTRELSLLPNDIATVPLLANDVLATPLDPARPLPASDTEVVDEADVLSTPSPTSLLAELESPETRRDCRNRAILEAASVPFTGANAERLKRFLRPFLERSFSTENPAERVVVSSAVRKYVAILTVDELPALASLIRAERKAPPSFEMEVAKMVVRKLTAILPPDMASLGPLADELMDIVRAYASPRALVKRYQGAAALEAVLAATMISDAHASEVLTVIRGLDSKWFREVVAARSCEIVKELDGRFAIERRQRVCAALTGLAEGALRIS